MQQCISFTSLEDNEGDKSTERLKMMRKQLIKIEKKIHKVSSSINQTKFIDLRANVEELRIRENDYKEIFLQNQEILTSTNELLIKLSKKLNIP